MSLSRLFRAGRHIEPFNVLIVAAVLLATWLPVRGDAGPPMHTLADLAVMLLFFLQGAKLAPAQIIQGLTHVRLHVAVFAATYALFPVVGWLLRPLGERLLGGDVYAGVLFLCASPSTIQSAVVFTAIAGGNVAAALCAATLSSLAGIALTPLLLRLLGVASGELGFSWHMVGTLAGQLLLPLVLGQLARRWIAAWVDARRAALRHYDQLTIVLVVYVTFSGAVVEGLWTRLSPGPFALLVMFDAIILAVVLTTTTWVSRAMRLSVQDEVTVVFCGSKKGLASGVPLANVLFPGGDAALLLIPLMVFHQLQLMVAAAMAQRYARLTQRARALEPAPPA